MAIPVRRDSVQIGAAVPSLVRWGLSSDADLVFRTLTTMGSRNARTLARELGLSGRRIEDALAELASASAATAVPGSRVGGTPPVWESRPPADVVAALRRRRLRLVDPDEQVRTHHAVVTRLADRTGGTAIAATTSIGGRRSDGVRYLPNRPDGA